MKKEKKDEEKEVDESKIVEANEEANKKPRKVEEVLRGLRSAYARVDLCKGCGGL